MIETLKCKETERLFNDIHSKKFNSITNVARRKLEVLEAAKSLFELVNPPGNRLEILKGNREGQYSIRINNKWRICFNWQNNSAYNVEIVDYH
jgi:proteic killer suppression protein